MGYCKKYVEIGIEGKTVFVSEVKECSSLEFIQKQKEAKETLEKVLDSLLTRIENLEKEVRVLKGEDD